MRMPLLFVTVATLGFVLSSTVVGKERGIFDEDARLIFASPSGLFTESTSELPGSTKTL